MPFAKGNPGGPGRKPVEKSVSELLRLILEAKNGDRSRLSDLLEQWVDLAAKDLSEGRDETLRGVLERGYGRTPQSIVQSVEVSTKIPDSVPTERLYEIATDTDTCGDPRD